VTDDGFLSLMSDDGSTKDDVKNPDGEVGDKITKMFQEEGKDTSGFTQVTNNLRSQLITQQTSLSSLPWARRLPLTRRRPPRLK
jgi:hypothetical protein